MSQRELDGPFTWPGCDRLVIESRLGPNEEVESFEVIYYPWSDGEGGPPGTVLDIIPLQENPERRSFVQIPDALRQQAQLAVSMIDEMRLLRD